MIKFFQKKKSMLKQFEIALDSYKTQNKTLINDLESKEYEMKRIRDAENYQISYLISELESTKKMNEQEIELSELRLKNNRAYLQALFEELERFKNGDEMMLMKERCNRLLKEIQEEKCKRFDLGNEKREIDKQLKLLKSENEELKKENDILRQINDN